jgi:predicted Zn-ribbon and HTH transcriptional regulator
MESAHQALTSALRSIRDQADSVLKQIERPQEQHSMRWKCKACRYMKHFTKPVALEAAGRCPRCKSPEFKRAV